MKQLYEAREIVSAPLDVEALPYQIQRLAMALLVHGCGTTKPSGEFWESTRLSLVDFLEGRAASLLSSVCAIRVQINEGRLDVIVSAMDGFYAEMEIWSQEFNYGNHIDFGPIRRKNLQPAAGAILSCFHMTKEKLYRYVFVGEGTTQQRLKAFARTELLADMVNLGQWITVVIGPRDISVQPYVATHDHGSWRIGHTVTDGPWKAPTPEPEAKKPSHLSLVK